AAAGLAVGPRLLAQRRRGIPVGAGLVDAGEHRRIPGDGPAFGAVPGDVLAPAPGEPGDGPELAPARAEHRLDAGLLGLARRGPPPGGRGLGRPPTPTGSGCRPTPSGRPADSCPSPDTGPCRWPTAG